MFIHFIFLFFFIIFSFSHDVFIDNNPISFKNEGTETNPYFSLYYAFNSTVIKNPNATFLEEFHFKIFPTNLPYIIDDSQIEARELFNTFLGKLFIEFQSDFIKIFNISLIYNKDKIKILLNIIY